MNTTVTRNAKEVFDLLHDDLAAIEREFGRDTVSRPNSRSMAARSSCNKSNTSLALRVTVVSKSVGPVNWSDSS